MFTHIAKEGRPKMIGVGHKRATNRRAVAQSTLIVPTGVATAIDADELRAKKGPVFDTAIIAGTMAAKRTAELIPFCHPLQIESCDFDIRRAGDNRIIITCTVEVHHKTGVEMEALTGASIAALTIYDMCKSLSRDIVIGETRLIEKSGGKSGTTRYGGEREQR